MLYFFALVFSVFSRNWVDVENDITTCLPADTETRQGLTVMNDNFVTYGSARVTRTATGTIMLQGRVREYICGVVDADIHGVLHGQINAAVSSENRKKPEKRRYGCRTSIALLACFSPQP